MTTSAGPLVLIVDDESTTADTLAAILRMNGFRSKAVYSGEAALADHPSCPEVVVSDVYLGGMSGIELAIRLRQTCPNCRILLMSGAASTSSLLDAAERDGHRFEIFAKPFHPATLLDWLRNEDPTPAQA